MDVLENYFRVHILNAGFYGLIFMSFPYLLNLHYQVSVSKDKVDSMINQGYLKPETEIYDYIIVGGGTAGAVLLNRLSANPSNRVLLLERGGDPDPLLDVPMFAPILVTNETDYSYYTVPQVDSFNGSPENRLHQIRGRGLGGSGNLNFMQYQRGNAKCYDEWAEITGDDSWKFKNILKYFKRLEDYHGSYPDRRYHSNGGEQTVSKQMFHPSSGIFFEACKEQNIKIMDINTGSQLAPVFAPAEVFEKRGKRAGPFQAFIKPIIYRPNLRIYRFSQVIKVNINSRLKATSVKYIRHGITRTVRAKEEIILSAGTIDTPKILMLSGIGPSEHLKSLNIKVVKDLPVGKNLQDHVCTVIDSFQFDRKVAFVPPRDLTPLSFLQYAAEGTGPLSATNAIFGTGFYSTPENPEKDIPDVQIFIAGTYWLNNPINTPIGGSTGVTSRSASTMLRSSKGDDTDANSMVILLARPESRDVVVLLNSADPYDNPIIDPKFFSKPSDINRLIKGVKFMVNLYNNSNIYKRIGTKLVLTEKILNRCDKHKLYSDDFWNCYIRYYTGVIHHPVGTCRMGKANDPRSVVDPKLKVIGIKRLRVVDGSIMPIIVNANTNAPIQVIAELASNFILNN